MGGDGHPVIVFDGMCVLCSANARFVLRHDRRGHFRLAAMQSEAGAALYRRFGIDPADPESLLVVQGDEALRDSDAILAIWSALGWPWRALGALRRCNARLFLRIRRSVAVIGRARWWARLPEANLRRRKV